MPIGIVMREYWGEIEVSMVSEIQPLLDSSMQSAEGSTGSPRFALRNWSLLLGLVVLPLMLLTLYHIIMFPGLTNTDALDFAQLGRNVSAGRGMVTYVLHPLALTHGTNALRQPDVTHGPFFPFLLGLAFSTAGARDAVASGVSSLFYLLTVPLLYALGLRVFNHAVGLIAATAFACSGLILEYAISGLPITLCIFLVTALFLVLYRIGARKAQAAQPDAPLRTKMILLAGALTGALYLTDPLFFWIIPIALGSVIWSGGSRWRKAVMLFLLPLCALALPWMARNLIVTGNPVFGMRGLELWMNTPKHFPGRTAYSLYSDEFPRGVYLLPAVGKKILMSLDTILRAMPQISDTWILAFLLPCLMFGYTSPAATMLRRVMMFSALAIMFGMLLFEIEMPLFCCLVPTMLVFSIAYLAHIVKQAKLSHLSLSIVSTLIGITIFYPVLNQMILAEKPRAAVETPAAKALGKMAQPGQLVLTDSPEEVAWYADRPAVQIPAVDVKVADIRSQFPEMRWLFLTPQARQQSADWRYLYDRCLSWNTKYLRAQMTNSEVPVSMQITGDSKPLYKALAGFTSVGPLRGATPTTVIAVLPDAKLSMSSKHNRDPVP